jgi:hypothetical protein
MNIPYLLELAPNVAPRLETGKVKHTNLTGGGTASCAGELWIAVSNTARLYVNGASGRYGPTTSQQLDDAVAVFRDLGFDVISYGWNEETQKPYPFYYVP